MNPNCGSCRTSIPRKRRGKQTKNELKAQDNKASHHDAVTIADLFLKVMSGKQPHVHQQTNIVLANRVAANKKRLAPIVKTSGSHTF